MSIHEAASAKREKLKSILEGMGSVLVAYSGGVDSTLLIRMARDVLGDHVVAVTASSVTYPFHELARARELAAAQGVRHVVIETDEIADPRFASNFTDRCYWCKKRLFTDLAAVARELELSWVLDGSNADDVNDFRPGMKAARECGVRSVLREAGITKAEVRELSRELGLPTWNQPSSACLASRVPYGTRITEDDLKKVDLAEAFLKRSGLSQVRVRHHGTVARIEVAEDEVPRLLESGVRPQISSYFKKLGYVYVAVDLDGYRSGSMNEVLSTGGS